MMRAWVCLAVILVAAFGAMAIDPHGPGEERLPAAAKAANQENAGNQAKGLTGISTSVSECKVCHSGPTVGLRDYIDKFGSDKFIKLNESNVWEQKDPHSVAFAKLMAGEIGKKMSVKYPNATTEKACLACHAVATGQPQNPYVGALENGIGCQGCHGLPEAWQARHFKSEKGLKVDWREWPVENKSAAGLNNLRDPVVKANLCVSCHVGDPLQEKVITHDMYKNGHPPLPPFELLSFMQSEPMHWGTPFDEKLTYFQSLDDKKALDLFSYHKADGQAGYAARHFAAGAIASLRAEVSLQAANAKKLPVHGDLDYARFDCYACHHELKLPSDRQKRGYDDAPGRPPFKAWVGSVALVAAKHLGENQKDKFEKLWSELKLELYAKPYGDPQKVIPKAEMIIAWCNEMEKEIISSKVYDRNGAKRLHDLLAERAREVTADPEAVMSLVWAYRELSKPLGEKELPDSLKSILPLTVRVTYSERTVPKTAGELTGPRMKTFIKFDSAKFLELFPK